MVSRGTCIQVHRVAEAGAWTSKLFLPSSDLSRVKITRRDPVTGIKARMVLDCSDSKPAPDFWLRDGDVIEGAGYRLKRENPLALLPSKRLLRPQAVEFLSC